MKLGRAVLLVVWSGFVLQSIALAGDPIAEIQAKAVEEGKSPVAHWGPDPNTYIGWSSHSNRLIPIYTFGTKGAGEGIDLDSYMGENSVYRQADKIKALYGQVPEGTLVPDAEYCDQTNIFDIQKHAVKAGKKHIFLVVFDGMDWFSTRTAAVAKTGEIYHEGKGHGLFFQNYCTQFGYMVTSCYSDSVRFNVDTQAVGKASKDGGYDPTQGGRFPWSMPTDPGYIIGKGTKVKHAYTDSSSSATSMSCGIKTFDGSIGVKFDGSQAKSIAHLAQEEGYAVGVVSSVPIPHATPGSMYAHNVSRGDYQDISRDLLGLPSVSHPSKPLPGMDVVIGTGYGVVKETDDKQGANYRPGLKYLADEDLAKADVKNGGKYFVSMRTAGTDGGKKIREDAAQAIREGHRFLGFYGTRYDHLPYQTANGDFQPVPGLKGRKEGYTPQDIKENPTLVDMTLAGIEVLASRSEKGFWMLVEPGDVDWASHQNNIDDMVGAIYSGDAAVKAIAEWVEKNSNWDESVMIVTADHGHYLVIDDLEAIAAAAKKQ